MPVKQKNLKNDFRPDLDVLVRQSSASSEGNADPRNLN